MTVELPDGSKKRYGPDGLVGFRWRRSVIDAISALAKQAGFKGVGIMAARNLYFVGRDEAGKMHLPYDRAVKLYDENARALGFNEGPLQPGDEVPNFYKSLT